MAGSFLRFEQFQSTLSMRRATLRGHVDRVVQPISIHALHEESDLRSHRAVRGVSISIHALHEESDQRLSNHRLPRMVISIHALHEESDSPPMAIGAMVTLFQSTLSMRRATGRYGV